MAQGRYLLAEMALGAGQVTLAATGKLARKMILRGMLAKARHERRQGVRMRRPEIKRLLFFEYTQ